MSTRPDPLSVACPQCNAAAGEKCKNWRGAGCAPHGDRVKAAKAAPGPVVCRPVGSLPLADVPRMPAEAAARLAAAGVVTLADLGVVAEAVRAKHTNPDHYPPGMSGSIVYAALREGRFALGNALAVQAGDALVEHLIPATVPKPKAVGPAGGRINRCARCGRGTDLMGGHLTAEECERAARGGIGKTRVRGELAAATPPTAPPAPPTADQWDEHTPPPRRRPQGTPVRAYEVLPAGEDVGVVFAGWDREGRIPAGSVLLRHVGTGLAAVSGYTLAAGTLAGCEAGGAVPLPVLDRLRLVCTVRVVGAGAWAVMAGGAA